MGRSWRLNCSPSAASTPQSETDRRRSSRASFDDLLQRTLGETIELRILGAGSAHLTVVDSSQLLNALLNLAINARDAMPARRTIDDRNQQRASRRRLCADVPGYSPRLLCPDHGHRHRIGHVGRGASARVRAVLHHQAGRRRHRTRSQHGLRVRQAVGRHIQIYSELGRGTSVRVFLPVADSAEELRSRRRSKREPRICRRDLKRYSWWRTTRVCSGS